MLENYLRYEPVNPELFKNNRQRLFEELPDNSLVILHANDTMPSNADGELGFIQQSNFYYLTGIDAPKSALILIKANNEQKSILFIEKSNPTMLLWEGSKLDLEQARQLSGLHEKSDKVTTLDEYEALVIQSISQLDSIWVDYEEHARSVNSVETRNQRYRKLLEKQGYSDFLDLSKLLIPLRMVKQPQEIAAIQNAISITGKAFKESLTMIKPNVGEWEIESYLLHQMQNKRSRRWAFTPIVASGLSACTLHYVSNHQVCQDGDLLLLDIGCEWANWNSDMTRVVPVSGLFTARQKEVYQAVLDVQNYAKSILKPGVLLAEYQAQNIEYTAQKLLDLGLMTAEEYTDETARITKTKEYFMHGVSHHLGLDVHDVNDINQPLQEGMVLTVEPGIYIARESIGIRLETNVLITPQGCKDLMADIPIEIEDIESLMSN